MREREDEQAAEIRRLKRELARVIEERNILKKATAYFVRESQRGPRSSIVRQAICTPNLPSGAAHRVEFSVRAMCRVLRVHFSVCWQTNSSQSPQGR